MAAFSDPQQRGKDVPSTGGNPGQVTLTVGTIGSCGVEEERAALFACQSLGHQPLLQDWSDLKGSSHRFGKRPTTCSYKRNLSDAAEIKTKSSSSVFTFIFRRQ